MQHCIPMKAIKKYRKSSDMQLHGRFNTLKQSLLETWTPDELCSRILQRCFTVKLQKCFEDCEKWLNFIFRWIVSLRWFLLVLSTTGTRVWTQFLWLSSCQRGAVLLTVLGWWDRNLTAAAASFSQWALCATNINIRLNGDILWCLLTVETHLKWEKAAACDWNKS